MGLNVGQKGRDTLYLVYDGFVRIQAQETARVLRGKAALSAVVLPDWRGPVSVTTGYSFAVLRSSVVMVRLNIMQIYFKKEYRHYYLCKFKTIAPKMQILPQLSGNDTSLAAGGNDLQVAQMADRQLRPLQRKISSAPVMLSVAKHLVD